MSFRRRRGRPRSAARTAVLDALAGGQLTARALVEMTGLTAREVDRALWNCTVSREVRVARDARGRVMTSTEPGMRRPSPVYERVPSVPAEQPPLAGPAWLPAGIGG